MWDPREDFPLDNVRHKKQNKTKIVGEAREMKLEVENIFILLSLADHVIMLWPIVTDSHIITELVTIRKVGKYRISVSCLELALKMSPLHRGLSSPHSLWLRKTLYDLAFYSALYNFILLTIILNLNVLFTQWVCLTRIKSKKRVPSSLVWLSWLENRPAHRNVHRKTIWYY